MKFWERLKFFKIIPQQTVGVIERFGKFQKMIHPGLNFKLPLIDEVSYLHYLKEKAVFVDRQTVITKDNVSLSIDGMIFLIIQDPFKVSYNVENPEDAIAQLTMTLMRNEIGKIELDNLFQERDTLNQAILTHLQEKIDEWGIQCIRYEILNIDPPNEIKKSMQQEAEAERNKRRDILISEGKRQSEINLAEGQKTSIIYKAEGEAQSVQIKAEMEKQSIQMIAKAIQESNLSANYMLTQNYLDALEQNLSESNVVVYPEGPQGQGQEWMGFAAMMMLQNKPQINQEVPQMPIQQQQQMQIQDKPQIKQEQKSQKKQKYDNPILDSDDDKQ